MALLSSAAKTAKMPSKAEPVVEAPAKQTTPVVILTTSSNPADVEACYRGGANGYITKSLDVEDMEVSIRKLVSFWLEVASLPQGEFHGRG